MPYRDIHDYGIIGDMSSCALIGRNGSLDWACFPRFDSPSAFAALLDDRRGGRFQISLRGPHDVQQRYLPGTNVLETTFTTPTGAARLVDFMPLSGPRRGGGPPHEIHRLLHGIEGSVEADIVFAPRLDYGRGETQLQATRQGVLARNGPERLALLAAVPLRVDAGVDGATATARCTVSAGDELAFVVAYGRERTPSVAAMDSQRKLERTVAFWSALSAGIHYDGRWRDLVHRSILALHTLIYRQTGAIVAAPTTSLPEHAGGTRNWDYRYCWLRDGAWTVGILSRLGDPYEADSFIRWMMERCNLGVDRMQVLYGIANDSQLAEHTLEHLEGYRHSRPVRVGNDAAFHRQTDVFGEVVLSMATYHLHHGRLPARGWPLVRRLADMAAEMWHQPDRGIWEVRGPEQHFVYSKLMCWVALDRAIHLAEGHGYRGPVGRWRKEATRIREEVLREGWAEHKQSFVQRYGSDALDASALLIPFMGLLPPNDPRIVSTVRAVIAELCDGAFAYRYRPEEVDDGLANESEGAFFILSFWIIGALIAIGDLPEALRRFETVIGAANHLGLMAEMVDPVTGRGLGNFPQAFSHIGLIHTARNLNRALGDAESGEPLIA